MTDPGVRGVLALVTRRRFAVRRVYVRRIADGRIAEHWGVRDDLGLSA